MKRIILFRFHGYSEVYTSRLKALIKLNPRIPIYGLYGGNKKVYNKTKKNFNQYFKNIYRIPVSNWRWRWKNGDLSINLWYKELGNKIDFDMVYIIEWDLLLFEPISKIYRNIKKNSVGLTGLKSLREVEDRWSWTSEEPCKTEWKKLLQYAKKKFNYLGKNYGCLGPGYCLPKKFLEKYSKLDIPELCHEELRLPLFAKILRFKIQDTKICYKWFDAEEYKIFNCRHVEVNKKAIITELKKPNGRRVFHPFYKNLSKDLMKFMK